MTASLLMRRVELVEYGESSPVRLAGEQLRQLNALAAHIEVAPTPNGRDEYTLKATSYVGAVNVGDLVVVVRPKVSMDRVMFLITYAMDPGNWRRDPVTLRRDADVIEAVALAFAHRTRQAIRRGLLRGYRPEEDALHTVRGSIRFGDQISKRFDIPLPIEVAFDEFTEDTEKNRMLKAAIERLGHGFIRSEKARRDVRNLRPPFASVTLTPYRRGLLPDIQYSRMEEHYRPAVELARLIIESSSLELFHGEVAGAAFFVDMNKVFEKFLYAALREALDLPESQWQHEASLTLDESERIRMKPDMSWRLPGERHGWRFVADAKYKTPPTGFEHSDVYQILAYCIAAALRHGMLVYAAGKADPVPYKIKHLGTTIEVTSIDLAGEPESILKAVDVLADRVRDFALAPA